MREMTPGPASPQEVALDPRTAGHVVLGDCGRDPRRFDAIVEVAADGTWKHPGTRDMRP